MSERVAAVLRAEERDIGRSCTLLDSAEMAHGVIVIVYTPKPWDDEILGSAREIRTATYVDGRPKYSTIVSTRWDGP